ncbi:MAG: hypothetical protein A3H60_01885 [Candidatus Zambryskibacteria bacterium RIFCSPLOWO2_02_FULL_44_12b]|uniref:Addiction module toxin, HicA family n=1 Tax=Candidatus Zambryskibacteria bacterium RIFCSPLOWO2_02_FULL_44_12b TaxID=1802772 RepID=A0A1G2UN81_9BACT|nr:MAG: hypothetical protein A3H60_01885 [Candidatus Zambryskibacteria bacterium RIFCSPLOWO2_02_FULL_44_12b]
MPKLFSSRHIILILEKNDFVKISQKGSHIKLFNRTHKLTVIVPANKREVPMGTFGSIVRQSGLRKEDFEV